MGRVLAPLSVARARISSFAAGRYGSRFIVLALLAIVLGASQRSIADPARFWLSTSNIVPGNPQAPDIPGIQAGTRTLNIWAQPATVNAGAAFNAGSNPFKTLQNFSLDVAADPNVVSFLTN